MIREIKFRAWDGTKMLQDVAIENGKYASYSMGDGYIILESKDYQLMQYTGLKDKNGVEIYEGDLLETDMNKKVFEIVFLNYSWCATSVRTKSNWNLNETYSLSDYLRNLKKGSANFEVIGNIYQNSELIK